MKYKYDQESDVLAISLSKKPFSYAQEMGDVIVHFDKADKPVYLEFLNAQKFWKHTTNTFPKTLLSSLVGELKLPEARHKSS